MTMIHIVSDDEMIDELYILGRYEWMQEAVCHNIWAVFILAVIVDSFVIIYYIKI